MTSVCLRYYFLPPTSIRLGTGGVANTSVLNGFVSANEGVRIYRCCGNFPIYKMSSDVCGKLGLATAALSAQKTKIALLLHDYTLGCICRNSDGVEAVKSLRECNC